jgi:DNA-binding NarL/FixJ family response regulator
MDPTTNGTNRGLRALLLDHDAAAQDGVRQALEARCCSVVAGDDGVVGLELLLGELLHLDALVVAADLPSRDARGFADLIRRAGGEQDLAIVVVAQHATAELRAALLAVGVDAVVPRGAGPDAVADAALAAIAARSSPIDDVPEPPPARAVEAPAPRQWELAFPRWSLLPA